MAVFEEAAVRIRNAISLAAHVEGDWTELTLRALVEIVQSPQVVAVVRNQSDVLEKSCMSIEATVSSGPLDHLGGVLRTRIQLLVGRAQAASDG